MKPHIEQLLKLQLPLPQTIADNRANCFNAVQLFWADEQEPAFTGPSEFVEYIESRFRLLPSGEKVIALDVAIVWTRSAHSLPVGAVRTDALSRRDEGYPFGLIIEHAFVLLETTTAFQKRDPSGSGPYEVIPRDQAIAPYINSKGFEVTYHRRM